MLNVGPLGGAEPIGRPVAARGKPVALPTNPADVVQLQNLAATASRPEHQALARVALEVPELAAHAAQSATLQAIGNGVSGPLPQLLAKVALDAMKEQPDLKSRAVLGHTYLEAMGNNPTTLVTLDDPLAAQTYQTSLLSYLPAPEEKGPATRQKHDDGHSPATNLFEHVNGRVNRFWLGLLGGHEGTRSDRTRKDAENLAGQVFKELMRTKNPPAGSPAAQVQAFHQAVGDMRARDRVGIEPLEPTLGLVDGLQSHEQLGALLGQLHRQGFSPLLTPMQYPQPHGGPALHLAPNAQVRGSDLHRIAEDHKFEQYAETLFRAAGSTDAALDAQKVAAVGRHLLRADVSTEEDPTTRRRLSVPAELPDYGATPRISYPKHLDSLTGLLSQVPLEDVKTFLRYSVLNNAASELGSQASRANLKSNHRINFWPDARPDAQTRSHLEPIFQQAYADRAVTPEKRALAQQVFDDVRSAFRQRIEHAGWLSEDGKRAAHEKLDKMQLEIGQPPGGWAPVKAPMNPGAHLENMLALEKERAEKLFSGQTKDWTWEHTRTDKPNAFYTPSRNTVSITAGALLDRALEPGAELAELYGTLGFTMAHELGHGFEASGTRHDADGKLRDWLPPEARQMFEMKLQGLVRQLKEGEPAYNEHGLGKAFVNEMGADLIGLSVAYDAFLMRNQDRTVKGGHTPEQRFFLHFGTEFSNRTGSMRVRDLDDPHPANEFRINATARNMPAYAAAFGLAPGTAMALDQARRAGLW